MGTFGNLGIIKKSRMTVKWIVKLSSISRYLNNVLTIFPLYLYYLTCYLICSTIYIVFLIVVEGCLLLATKLQKISCITFGYIEKLPFDGLLL